MVGYSVRTICWTTEVYWFECQYLQEIFSFPKRPEGLGNPASLLFSVYRGLFPGYKVKVFTAIWCENRNAWSCTFAPPLRLQGLNTDFAVWRFSN